MLNINNDIYKKIIFIIGYIIYLYLLYNIIFIKNDNQ